MTLRAIAELANVSVSTVSKALSDSYDIAPETRALVLKIATESGYFTDKKATRMQNSRLREPTVAIICPEIISIHYSHITTVLSDTLAARGAKSILYLSGFSEKTVQSIIDECLNDSRIAAVISLATVPLHIPSDNHTPVLLLEDTASRNSIRMQMNEGIALAVDHLRAGGHTRIGFVGEALVSGKLTLFRRVMAARRLPVDENAVFIGTRRFEAAGKEAAERFLTRGGEKPTAVICGYDELACGFLDVLQKSGLTAPQDISVIGINNIPLSAYCFGGLTTVDLIDTAVLSRAIDDLLDDVVRRRPTPHTYRMVPRLIVRHTTAPLSKKIEKTC